VTDALQARIAGLFEEPGCNTNQQKGAKERKAGCKKPLTPGAAAGGCAFDGAKIALQPIADAVHLVHGPAACEGNGWDGRHTPSSGPQLYRLGLSTDLTELDIVMGGGEKKLYRAIKEAVARHSPAAVFVYSTCVPALIGDDVDAVCKHATQRLGTPVIPVNAPGFAGSKNLGNKLAGAALLEHVIGTREPTERTPFDVNLIGEYNVAGEFWQVRPLLERAGVRVQACITGDSRYGQIAASHRARVNLMVCSTALINVARTMQERYGIPYFEGSFYGVENTSTSLRTLARHLVERGAPAELIVRTEGVIAAEEARAQARLEPYRQRLKGKKALLYTGGVKSWSVVSSLQELGMEVIATSVRKSTEDDKHRALELLGDEAAVVDSIPPREMYARLARGDADVLLSGGRTQFVALKARVPWLDINQERAHAYAGYEGAVALARQIDLELRNPLWRDVRRPAPWDEGGAGGDHRPR
jgi:nitrogenase molybdenum-cofactor synthesis protein NifE